MWEPLLPIIPMANKSQRELIERLAATLKKPASQILPKNIAHVGKLPRKEATKVIADLRRKLK